MPVIDVSGLPEAVVSDLRRLVQTLKVAPSAPPPTETVAQWSARFKAWAESHPKREIVIDDSRESIYVGCGD